MATEADEEPVGRQGHCAYVKCHEPVSDHQLELCVWHATIAKKYLATRHTREVSAREDATRRKREHRAKTGT
jgi:hypothetical protein